MSREITKAKFLSLDEIKELNDSLSLVSLRDRLLISLLLNLGMRGAEALEIRTEDVSVSEASIQVPGKKNSKPRHFPIPDALRAEMAKYLKTRAGCEYLFDLTTSGLKYIWNQVRPAKKGVHSLRHTFAIQLFKKTRDIKLVQVCLGHRSIQNTMIYADYVYSKEEMQKALLGDLYFG